MPGGQGVVGSNPAAPTKTENGPLRPVVICGVVGENMLLQLLDRPPF